MVVLNHAFRIAGFPNGRPSLPIPDDYIPTFGGSYEVIASLFSDILIDDMVAEAGTGNGADYHFAALLLEYLLEAGYATDGRRLDTTAVNIGDASITYAAENEHRTDMSRRIRAIRSRAIRLDGGIAPASNGGGNGVNDAAVNALIAAHTGIPNAHHVPGGTIAVATNVEGRVPALDVSMRIGWAQTQDPVEAVFIRANNHPVDGAAIGTVDGMFPPPFPPALASDASLYLYIWIATAPANVAEITLRGGGSLLSSGSALADFELEGVDGAIWISNQRLSAGVSNISISATVVGDIIATRPWVTDAIAAAGIDPADPNDPTAAIAAHTAIPNAHHVPGMDGNAEALIVAHTALPNAHHVPTVIPDAVDVPALIAEHTAEANAHHVPTVIPEGNGGGGFPTTRTEILNVVLTSSDANVAPSENTLPSQLYEISLRTAGQVRGYALFITPSAIPAVDTLDNRIDIPLARTESNNDSFTPSAYVSFFATNLIAVVIRNTDEDDISIIINKLT